MAGSDEDKISDAIGEDGRLHKSISAVTMSPELFERLYLSPKIPHTGDYNKRFANPTALGFVGFVISTFTFAVVMMGWGGASGLSPVVGIFFFVGPVLLTLSIIFEWIMGNFFSMMVMGLFDVFWLSFGMLQLPTLGLGTAYATAADKTGTLSPEYNAVVALYLIVWGFALFTFFIFTCRINLVFAGIFFFVSVAAWVLSGAYWKISTGDYVVAGRLQKTGGALLFIVAALGWYMCFIIMAGEMRMSLGRRLPVGDLSHFFDRTDVELAAADKQA